MELGLIIGGVGLVAFLVAKVLLMLKAFTVSSRWGWMVLLLPFVGAVFTMKRWDRARTPFFISVAAILMMGYSAYGLLSEDGVVTLVGPKAVSSPVSLENGGASPEKEKNVFARLSPTKSEPAPVVSDSKAVVIGMSLSDLHRSHGKPQGTMNHGGVMVYIYQGFSVETTDGRTVSSYQRL